MYPSSVVSDTAYHPNSDFVADHENRKIQQKLDNMNTFRPNMGSFLARPRHLANRTGLPPTQFRDTPSFYPTSPSEAFPPSVTSPVQPHMPQFEHRPNYDFGAPNNVNGIGGGPKPFTDTYSTAPMIQSHQINGTKPQPSQPTQQSPYSLPFANGPQMSSQTPYGPHIMASTSASSTINGTSSLQSPGLAAPVSTMSSNVASVPNIQPNNEEISTIFVVGFPDDMQEREFQNMFTFSPDFEAATLKIPNKEYTAYGNVPGGVSGGLRNGATGYPTYAGANDPYNLVTVNQGGVVVDTGRDGTVTSWPAAPGEDGGHFNAGAAAAGMNVPRKQIIGFAKFRTREAALLARDGLQGRRVDIDKGAVLKAEMAKKNLHTKRGVGPVSLGTVGPTNGTGAGPASATIHQGFTSPTTATATPYSAPNVDALGAREREMGTIGAMGLGGRLNQWRDQPSQQDHTANGANGLHLGDRAEDDRRANLMNAMGLTSLGAITRGPRERAEDDERERRRKEKDALRLRAGNPSAYEAFHSVPSTVVRQVSNASGLLTPSENEAGGVNPISVNGITPGPWDDVRSRLPRPRSSSRSVSPPKANEFASQLSPSIEQSHFQYFPHIRGDQRTHEQFPESNQSSGVTGPPLSATSGLDGQNVDAELSRALGGLDMNTETGKTSPELPSPSSGASSRNGIDQNPPINTLYVGNLPTSTSATGFPQDHLEASLRDLFQNRPGYRRLCFRQKPNGPMCFVEFEDVAHATKALNDLYGNTLKGLVKGGIRLSYSKNPLGVRTPTSAGSNGSMQQQQSHSGSGGGPTNSFPVSFPSDYHPRFNDEQQSRGAPLTVRRDMAVSTSPMPPGQPFMADFGPSSPSPRFSISPPGVNTSTGLGNAFTPRYGYNLAPSSGAHSSSTFSPFGLSSTPPPTSTIPDHQISADHQSSHPQHLVHHNFTPVHNLEAARAG